MKGAVPDWDKIRAQFPWTEKQLMLNPAGWHPMRISAIQAMHRYLDFKLRGPTEGRGQFASGSQEDARRMFARLVNAATAGVSFVQSTLMGENLVMAGLGIPSNGWNVVTDELHYEGSLYLYGSLRKQGLDLRIVKVRDDHKVHVADYEKLVDRKTRLIATSLVSYQNGYRPDIRGLADLAHAHGAYLYTDIIQAAGAVPIDVRALDADFCACSGYKWLMGDRGLGFLYVRESLQGKVMHRTQYGDRQFSDFQYHMFPHDPPGERPASWKVRGGAGAHYEVGNIANVVAAGHADNLQFILDLGIDRIQGYVNPMVERLRKELPGLGYASLTPVDTPTPTSAFVVPHPDKLREKLRRANIDTKVQWNQMRVSVSVYHRMSDIDRFLGVVS